MPGRGPLYRIFAAAELSAMRWYTTDTGRVGLASGHKSFPDASHQTHDKPGQEYKEKKHHRYRLGDPDPELFPSCRIPCQCRDTNRFRHWVITVEIVYQPAQVLRDVGMLRHDIGGFTGVSSKVKQQVTVM